MIVFLKECLVSPVVVDKRSCDNETAVVFLLIFSCVGGVFVSTERILVFSIWLVSVSECSIFSLGALMYLLFFIPLLHDIRPT